MSKKNNLLKAQAAEESRLQLTGEIMSSFSIYLSFAYHSFFFFFLIKVLKRIYCNLSFFHFGRYNQTLTEVNLCHENEGRR